MSPLFEEPIKYMTFYNNTDLPVLLSSWKDRSSILSEERIGPQEKKVIHSSVGEWHLSSMFERGGDREAWKNAGLENHLIIGKFRSQPCISGNYSWMEYDKPFDCIYSESDLGGLITFIRSST